MIRKQSTDSRQERKGILKTELKYAKQKSLDSRNNQTIYQDSHDLGSYGRSSRNQRSENENILTSETQQANAVLMDLRPEDKGRVGQLIKRLAEEKQIKENLQMKIQENSKEFYDRFNLSQKEKQGILNDTLILKEKLQQSMNLLQKYQSSSSSTAEVQNRRTACSRQNSSGLGNYKLSQSLPFKENDEDTITNSNNSFVISTQIKHKLSDNFDANGNFLANQNSNVIHSKYQRNSLSPFSKSMRKIDQANGSTDLFPRAVSASKPERIIIKKKNGESEQLYNTWKKSNMNYANNDQSMCNSYFKEEFQDFKSLREVKQLHSKMEELTSSLKKISQQYCTNQFNIPTQIQPIKSNSRENTPQRMLQGDVRSISTQQAQTSQNEHFISKESFLGANVESNEVDQQQEVEEIKIAQRILDQKRQRLLYHLQGSQRLMNEKENVSTLANVKRNETNGKQLESSSRGKKDYPVPQAYPTFSRDSLAPASVEDSCFGKVSSSGLMARENMNNDVMFEDEELFQNSDLLRQTTQKIIQKMDKKELQRLRKQLKKRINQLDQDKQNPREFIKQSVLNANSNILEISDSQQINSLKDSELLRYSQNTQSLSAPFSKSKDSFQKVYSDTRNEGSYDYHADSMRNRNDQKEQVNPYGVSNNHLNYSHHSQLRDNAQSLMIPNQIKQQNHQQVMNEQLLYKQQQNNQQNDQNSQEYYELQENNLSIKSRIFSKLEELREEDLEEVMAVIAAKKNKKSDQYQKMKNTHETDFDEREEQKNSKIDNQSCNLDQPEGQMEFKIPKIQMHQKGQTLNEESTLLNQFEMPQQMFPRILNEKNHKNNNKNQTNTLDTHSSSNSNKSFEYKNRLKYEASEDLDEETDKSTHQNKRKNNHKK